MESLLSVPMQDTAGPQARISTAKWVEHAAPRRAVPCGFWVLSLLICIAAPVSLLLALLGYKEWD